jgi:hypothetical protein
MSDSEPLPTSGPLGKSDHYQVSNRDLWDNALKQNEVINKVHSTVGALDGKVQVLATTVSSHAKVIGLLEQIKTIAIWLLAFLGIGGIGSFLNWVRTWWTGH